MELQIGQQASRTMIIDADMVRAFAEITGDYNPLHFGEAFAAETRLGGDGSALRGLRW